MRDYMSSEKRCMDCGVVMAGVGSSRKRCDKCNLAIKRIRAAGSQRRRKGQPGEASEAREARFREKILRAKELGISYGKLVAMEEAERMKTDPVPF